jgi:hypothetical protein
MHLLLDVAAPLSPSEHTAELSPEFLEKFSFLLEDAKNETADYKYELHSVLVHSGEMRGFLFFIIFF